jgi:hypothetical protein
MISKLWGRRAGAWAAMALAAASLAACAEGARPDSMALTTGVSPVAATDPAYKAFRVAHVDGGSQTNPLWESNVSSEDFEKALENSLRAYGFLADDPTRAKNEITANLQELQRPLAGLDVTVTSRVHYSAKSTGDQKVIFDDVVAASGTAKLSDTLLGVQRLQFANEAAMKENIRSFIERLRKALGEVKTAQN